MPCSSILKSRNFKGRSNTWAHKLKKDRIKTNCKFCGKEMLYLQSDVSGSSTKEFCSVQCVGKHKSLSKNLIIKNCFVCNKDIQVRPDFLREKNFCSHKCYGDTLKKDVPKNNSNREYMRKYLSDYYVKNKDKVLMHCKRYRNKNKARIAVLNRKRNGVKVVGNLKISEWMDILSMYDYACLCCGSRDKKLTIDHIVSLKNGGLHTADNVQPLCQSCNSRKGAKNIDYRKKTK